MNTLLRQNDAAMIAQKSLEVDTDLQKIGTDMITMFRLAKEEKQTKNWLNQDFSQDDNDVKKKKKKSSSESSC